MIVRQNADTSCILINQTDHASLSGIMAAHWGNAQFARPEPFQSVVRAAALHDSGWRNYEAAPHYDLERKAPPTFTATPLTVQQLAAYQSAIDWLSDIDLYAGLLIGRHRLGLWRRRFDAIAEPAPSPPRPLIEEANAFIARNEKRQEAELEKLDRRTFLINYQLLQILDLLSLYLCTAEPVQTRIGMAPTSYDGDGKSGVLLSLTPRDSRRIAIDPYPFDTRPLEVSVVYRFLPPGGFASVESFRQAYFGAAPRTMTFELV